MSQTRMRWMKWHPADFSADPAVRMCSMAARGLWVEIIGLAHMAEPYGHLLVNGRAPSPRQLAAVVGCGEREVRRLLRELEDAGVFSRTAEGVIYCRRMLRDRELSDVGRRNGTLGGNPILRGQVPDLKVIQGSKGLTPPLGVGDKLESETEIELEESPLPHAAGAARGDETDPPDQENGARPDGWRGQWKGLRANGTNPRARAAKEAAAAPPPPEPDHPLWPRLRSSVAPEEFRAWLSKLTLVREREKGSRDPALLTVPSRFLRDHIRQHYALPLEKALGAFDIEVRKEPVHAT